MRYATDFLTARDLDAKLLDRTGDLPSFMLCPECRDLVQFIAPSDGKSPHFRHTTPIEQAGPCALRAESRGFNGAGSAALRSYPEHDLQTIVSALEKHVLHPLMTRRNFFGGDKEVYLRARKERPLFKFADRETWQALARDIYAGFKHQEFFSRSRSHQIFLEHLLNPGQAHATTRDGTPVDTSFTLLLYYAWSAALKLFSTEMERFKAADCAQQADECRTIVSLAMRGPGAFMEAPPDPQIVGRFAQNLLPTAAENAETSRMILLVHVVVERFLKIVFDLDLDLLFGDPSKVHPSSGFVYVLKAPERAIGLTILDRLKTRGVIKIGKTSRLPKQRADEWSIGFIGQSYELVHFEWTKDPDTLEARCLEAARAVAGAPVKGLEFFDMRPERARGVVQREARRLMREHRQYSAVA